MRRIQKKTLDMSGTNWEALKLAMGGEELAGWGGRVKQGEITMNV